MVLEQVVVPRMTTPGISVKAGTSFLSSDVKLYLAIMAWVALIAIVLIGYRVWSVREDRRVKRLQHEKPGW